MDAKWERAVEGVLGSSLQSIVVPTPDDAVRAAQWLRENNGGRASFLVAGLHGGSEELDTLTCKLEERSTLSLSLTDELREDLRICDLLGAPGELITVLTRTMPQKMNACISGNLEDAMAKSIAFGASTQSAVDPFPSFDLTGGRCHSSCIGAGHSAAG